MVFLVKVRNMIRAGSLVAIVVGLAIGLSCAPAGAQHFSFSVGSHHGHHGHHHHHHGWHGHYHWYHPHYDHVYVYPQPRVTYVQPATVLPYQPTVTAAPTPATPTATVQIWNSAGQRVPVVFLANSRNVTLSDGQSHTLYGAGAQTIEFDRGGGYGTARYELAAGEYEFTLTSRGWDLAKKSDGAAVSSRPEVPKNSLPASGLVR
jgi:hypothetical protein